MQYMLVRNRVKDYETWRRVFDEQDAARAAGLHLLNLWRSVDDPNEVFFLFEVHDRAKAEAFVSAPESHAAGERAGVIDGELHYVEAAE